MKTNQYVTVPEAARRLKITPSRAYQLIKAGYIPMADLPGQQLIDASILPGLTWPGRKGKRK